MDIYKQVGSMSKRHELSEESDVKILYFYLMSAILGLLVGFVGTTFHVFSLIMASFRSNSIYFLSHNLHLPQVIASIVICSLMILFSIFLVRWFAPEAAGSGVQEIEGALLGERPMFWRRLLPVKFIAGIFSIGSNLVVGREGPTIQLGGNLGQMVAEKCGVDGEKLTFLIGSGAAAGLAVAFNAPLAGILFFIEELREHCRFCFVSFIAVAVSCIMATMIYRSYFGAGAVISMPLLPSPNLTSLIIFFVFGLMVGLLGLFFNLTIMKLLMFIDSLSLKSKVIYFSIVACIIGAINAFYPEAVGGGYRILGNALNAPMVLNYLLLMLAGRFILTLLSYSTGAPGGIFAPLLAIGTLFGLAFAHLLFFFWQPVGVSADMFAIAGMGGLFAASIRAPITGIVLIVEMTQNYHLILPSMVTCLVATIVVQLAKNPPIYSQLLIRTKRISSSYSR